VETAGARDWTRGRFGLTVALAVVVLAPAVAILTAAFSMVSEWPPSAPTRYANSTLPPRTAGGIGTDSLPDECGALAFDKGTHLE